MRPRGGPNPAAARQQRTYLTWLAIMPCRDACSLHLWSTRRHDGEVRPWKRRLSDDECSVLLAELLLRHPELAAEAEEITSMLLVVESDQELAGEITAKLRALRASGPVSVDAGRGRVLDVLQPYIDDLTRRKERGARRAAADIAIAVLSGLYECREDSRCRRWRMSAPSRSGTRRAETRIAVGAGRVIAVARLARRARIGARPAFPRGLRAGHAAVSARG